MGAADIEKEIRNQSYAHYFVQFKGFCMRSSNEEQILSRENCTSSIKRRLFWPSLSISWMHCMATAFKLVTRIWLNLNIRLLICLLRIDRVFNTIILMRKSYGPYYWAILLGKCPYDMAHTTGPYYWVSVRMIWLLWYRPHRMAQNLNSSDNYWSKCENVTWMNLIAIIVFCGNLADKCFSQGSTDQISIKGLFLWFKLVHIFPRSPYPSPWIPDFSYGFDHSDLILELFSNHG